jgi:hypothetical protein
MVRRSNLTALAAVVALGCTAVGSGKGAKPAWKTYVDEHPVTSTPYTLRAGSAEVRVHAVVVQESHTLVGRSSWLNVVKASVENLGPAPLRLDDLAGGFTVRTRSGADLRAHVFTVGRAGWRQPERAGEPMQLPPRAVGEIRVQAEPNDGSRRDDPVSVTLRGQTVELR